ncbi:MAG: LPS export ABC transporter periplasmic protein LptC [Acidobacteriaceae bacterium]|nr:LPS export ABC transporter periplasmic protein LptC [Acidobacteriaceae bacterium]MBV9779923.1 LPS export ABC transporter periplasmic protein LptC [Acidobacteriaceae bacterium]
MRRISVLLAFAAILLSALVAYTYRLRVEKEKKRPPIPAPAIDTKLEALAKSGWHWQKDDPQTNKPIVRAEARSFEAAHQPSSFELKDVGLRLYAKDASSYTYVRSREALFDEGSGVLKSDGPVSIIMNVPADKNAEKKSDVENLVQIDTSGITYETKTGRARTDRPASFHFAEGDGQAVGADYDPNTRELHLKAQIALDWIGKGPLENKMHIETGDLIYKEREQKIYLSPWAKLVRQNTTIQGGNSVVTLVDGVLHQIDSDHPFGTDVRDDRQTSYSAETMTALFDDNGVMVNILAQRHAQIVSKELSSRTTITSDRADLRFTVDSKKQPNGQVQNDSDLHLVLADGHANAESVPLPQPGVQLPETRILRSEHIELEMKPGGKEVQEIRAPSQAQLEFKPNRAEQSHRTLDASRLRIVYGASSYVDSFLAWNVATHTDKPATAAPVKAAPVKDTPGADDRREPEHPPALTWSDQMIAKFTPNSNQIATIEQTGNFRYEEGVRRAQAKKAFLEQTINRITLSDAARVSDDTGATLADNIVMNQVNGDMDASGHVVSSHEPDKNAKQGTSMLDDTQAMQATADKMITRENNTKVHYEGHAVMWQGANRVSANVIDVDRDEQTLHAVGSVVSELVDNRSDDKGQDPSAQADPAQTPKKADTSPVFTIVRAPEMFYRDDQKIAVYTGGVQLQREKMTVKAKELRAFLTPKSEKKSNESSLNHAFAEGGVVIVEVRPDRTRTGTSQHCEYYTRENKVVLNGGLVQMVDSYKGVTKGRQLTYYDDDDRLVVEGEKKQLAYTQMKKK